MKLQQGGQQEIDLEFSPLVSMADDLLKYKYVVKNVAKQHGLSATFMPKPLFGDNGSGMHVHSSIWKEGKTLMYKKGNYADLSDFASTLYWWYFKTCTSSFSIMRSNNQFL